MVLKPQAGGSLRKGVEIARSSASGLRTFMGKSTGLLKRFCTIAYGLALPHNIYLRDYMVSFFYIFSSYNQASAKGSVTGYILLSRDVVGRFRSTQ